MEYETIIGDVLRKLPPLHPLSLLEKAITQDNLRSHAFLISGGLWEGQIYWAKYFAMKAAQLDDAQIISLQQNFDMHILPDTGERISIDESKTLRTKLTQSARGRRHIVIIENIERLNSHNANNEAANALLKILEEPPVETLFLLTTSSVYEVLPTIISRVQVVPCTMTEDLYSSFIPDTENIGSKIELAAKLQDQDFYKVWQQIGEYTKEVFNKKKSLTERIIMLDFLYLSAKDSEKDDNVFSRKNIFFFQMEMAIEERFKMSTIDKDTISELTRVHKNLLQLKKDFASFINKKLAVEHFFISSFLPSVYE
ncbi:MAG: AAA family ATPase [Candidatus Gracilibacteria bacterium]